MTGFNLRQQTASDLRTVHPRWLDADADADDGSRAATTHPNYGVVRHLWQRIDRYQIALTDEPDLICKEWRRLLGCPTGPGCYCVVAYAVADEIGMKPHRYARLETLVAGDPYSPDTVMWTFEPWSRGSVATRALQTRAANGDPAARTALWLRENPPSTGDLHRIRVFEHAAQRGFRSCDCLPPGFECDIHAAARWASVISEMEAPLLAKEEQD